MAGEIATVAADVMPYVTAAAGAYGLAVLKKAEDSAAGKTVDAMARWGKRALQAVFGHRAEGEPLPEVLADVIGNPGEEVFASALESAIAVALTKNARMLAEVREILAEVGPQPTVTQNIKAGRDAFAAGRDMTINHR